MEKKEKEKEKEKKERVDKKPETFLDKSKKKKGKKDINSIERLVKLPGRLLYYQASSTAKNRERKCMNINFGFFDTFCEIGFIAHLNVLKSMYM